MAKKDELPAVHSCECPICQQRPHSTTAQEHRVVNRLVASTDERSRRLFVGLLARQHGHGGITLLARITGLDRNTIARGQRELHRDTRILRGRSRRPGGGRSALKKKSRHREGPGGAVGGRHGRRPDHWPEVDTSLAS